MNHNRTALWLLLVSIGFHLVPPFLRTVPLFSDETQYFQIARDIPATGSHTTHVYFPSGYGYFAALWIALLGEGMRSVLVPQSILSAMLPPMIYLLARRSALGHGASLAGAGLFLSLIQPWLHGGLLLSDTFFVTASFAAFFLMFYRENRSVWTHSAAGFLLGWASTARTVGLVGLLLAGAWLLFHRGERGSTPRARRLSTIGYFAAAALPLGLVLTVNWSVHHRLFLEANTGWNLWKGNHPGVEFFPSGTEGETEGAPLPGESVHQWGGRITQEALRHVAAEPFLFLGRWGARLAQVAGPNPGREVLYGFRDRLDAKIVVALHVLQSWLLWSSVLAGLIFGLRRSRLRVAAAVYLIAYCSVVAVAFMVPRYRLPALPFACLLFAAGAQVTLDAWGQRGGQTEATPRRAGSNRETRRLRRLWLLGLVLLVAINLAFQGWKLRARGQDPSYWKTWSDAQFNVGAPDAACWSDFHARDGADTDRHSPAARLRRVRSS